MGIQLSTRECKSVSHINASHRGCKSVSHTNASHGDTTFNNTDNHTVRTSSLESTELSGLWLLICSRHFRHTRFAPRQLSSSLGKSCDGYSFCSCHFHHIAYVRRQLSCSVGRLCEGSPPPPPLCFLFFLPLQPAQCVIIFDLKVAA